MKTITINNIVLNEEQMQEVAIAYNKQAGKTGRYMKMTENEAFELKQAQLEEAKNNKAHETLLRTDFDYALADTDIEQKLHDCLKQLEDNGWDLDRDELLFRIGGMKNQN